MCDKAIPIIRDLGMQDYTEVWHQMREYTLARDNNSQNQIWLVEHPPVFTLGRAGKIANLLVQNDIPMIKIDRGGDITYHGPGQFVAYLLFDIRRDGIGIKHFVRLIEQSVIDYLASLDIVAERKEGHPGIYTKFGKISALGLNCKQHGTYHGVSINVSMDLNPFEQINPCGISQAITQIKHWHPDISMAHCKEHWSHYFSILWGNRNERVVSN